MGAPRVAGGPWRHWALLALLGLGGVGCGNKAQDHIRDARNAVFEKRPQRALERYRMAVEALERDESPKAQVQRARALRGAADVYDLELRDYRRAVEVYRELIQACPEAPESLEARIRLATILREQFHDLRGAIKELTAAIQRNPPESAELRYRVAKIYFELGDYQQCALEAREVVKRYETSDFVDDAMFLEAQALAMEPGKDEAIRAFGALAERYAESEFRPHAVFELGKLYAEQGDGKQAIALWVEALKSHPQPETVQQAIARARKRLIDTTPAPLNREGAFGRAQAQAHARVAPVERKAAAAKEKTSVEAAGGTAEEAARDFGD